MNFKIFKNLKYVEIFKFNTCYSTRVRFAPSPTGLFHVGGLKSALINFLFAKSTNGKLILRIEDTDQSRYDCNSIDHLIKSLNWLNITFDEGLINNKPDKNFVQSNRLSLYRHYVDLLLKENKAYYCFCSNSRLDFLRKEQFRRGESPGYDRKCLHLTKDEIENKMLQQLDYTVRLKLNKDSSVNFNDEVFGNVAIPLSVESDPIILKSDGYPVYHLANVVDDHDMQISHVIRGQEWLVSTPKHLTIYEAFGWKPPIFGHLPLVVKDNGVKISKRDPDFISSYYNIDMLIANGYTTDSVRSWLMSCGGGLTVDWYPSITLDDMIEKFSISRITTHNARLSQNTLDLAGKAHINRISLSQDYFNDNILYFLNFHLIKLNYDEFSQVFNTMKAHMTCFNDILKYSYIWSFSPLKIEDYLNVLNQDNGGTEKIELLYELLNRLVSILKTKEDSIIHLKNIHKSLCNRSLAMTCIRMAIIGKEEGPKISELISILKTEELLKRLNSTITLINCKNKNKLSS